MNWKNRLTNYNFWVSIVSAVILILQALKIDFDFMYINEIVTAVLGLLVVIGIINDPTKSSKSSETKNVEETNNPEVSTPTTENAEETITENVNSENVDEFNTANAEIATSETALTLTQTAQNDEATENAVVANSQLPSNQENEVVVDFVQNNPPADFMEIEKINQNLNLNPSQIDINVETALETEQNIETEQIANANVAIVEETENS